MNYFQLSIILYFQLISEQAECNFVHVSNDTFIIKTEGCSITDISDERETIKAMSGPSEIENCDQEDQLLDSNATHIWIMRNMSASFNIRDWSAISCCYRNFSASKNIRNILYGDCQRFLTGIEAKHEFVRVDCSYNDLVIYSDYFVFNPDESRPRRAIDESSFNVIILGLESLSRLNFERTMPKTAKFLEERGAVPLKGYNKVGRNSFPNLFPLLTGRSFNSCKTIECSFIWELYKDAGYYTALGSDSVVGAMGDYEYDWPTIPTDYYLQPFMAEANKVIPDTIPNYDRRCLRRKPFYKIVLSYIRGLLRNLKHGNKLFGFFWEESVTHNFLKKPQLMDEGYLKFLTELENNKLLDDIILIVMSDHGMRWGGFSKTRQGLQEGNLPLFSVLLPSSFRETFKDAYTNYQLNSNRLTTPYDAYRTLVDLVSPRFLEDYLLRKRIRENKSGDVSLSLFLPVSENRTCLSMDIEEAWCTCDSNTAETEPLQKREIAMAATVILNNINRILADFPKCQTLKLRKIGDAEMKAVSNIGRTYRVVLEVTPGGGIFQGTVRHQRSRWIALGPIARLNRFSNKASCVDHGLIKLYCFCTKNQ